MLTDSPDHPIHHPHNPDKFEFDEEVTQIFDDMAKRSIPMYDEARRLTVEVAYDKYISTIEDGKTFTILDIGASTGAFFKEFWNRARVPLNQPVKGLNAFAVELSQPMYDTLEKDLPYVNVYLEDATMVDNLHLRCDVVNMSYVAQFIPHAQRKNLYSKLHNILNEDGLLFMSQKEDMSGLFEELLTEEYMKFRRAHGYTQEEIDAKTKALRGAMWCELPCITWDRLQDVGFSTITELCRWLQFSTIVCYK